MSKLIVAVALAASSYLIVDEASSQAKRDATAEIIRQSAICANNVPGEGLERRGDSLVGWMNVLVTGKHLLIVPGATEVRVNNEVGPVQLTQGQYVKVVVKISTNGIFDPSLRMPNGMEWKVPTWMLYSLSKSSVRKDTAVIPEITQKAKP